VTETTATPDPGPDAADGQASTATLRLVLLVALCVSLALAVAVFVGLAVTGDSDPRDILDGESTSESGSDRQDAMARAQQFLVRVNTYGPDELAEDGTMPGYREGVLEIITPKLAESFEQTVTAAEATVAQAGFGRETEVFGVGVSAIDADSASVLVAGSLTNSYPTDPEELDGERQDDPAGPLPFRIEVKLVKVEGEWLVDAFSPVADLGAEPSGSPSDETVPSPSEEATP
jgi:Mce-associated membrane protein